ncbi:RWD domain-containing protein 3 isoform X1 [Phyllobates terribilis]|uniref:RWD domain-containing protein 3 isoform X1 n=1 Tax=Phyllobates terribilis TaxID=111132 RepID=UPI003CCB0F88
MSEAAQEEISVLSAIYCDPGECEVLSCSESGITVMIQTNVRRIAESELRLRLVFDLPVTYPSCLPNLSVSSEELTRTQCKELRDKLLERARECLFQPMIHDLVLWTQQNFNSVIGNSIRDEEHLPSAMTDDGTWTALLHLDHMRAKNKYVKTVEKWTSDLELTGKLMFTGKIILILLQGDRSNIREYMVLQKTYKVDVDSSGKKCKEKMISVLCEVKLPPEHKKFPAFEVKEYSSISELEKEFEMAGLSNIFTEFVMGLF